jgi:hypothetical protein
VPARSPGFTLLETNNSAGLLTVVMGGILTVAFRSEIFVTDEMRRYNLEQTGRRVVQRLLDELRSADPTTIAPLIMADSDFIEYQQPTGFVAGAVTYGPVTRIEFELATGETDDGTDENGDGRIDEGFITITEAGGTPIVIAEEILGLRFNRSLVGVAIDFEVDLAVLDRDGNLLQRTFSQTVSQRN